MSMSALPMPAYYYCRICKNATPHVVLCDTCETKWGARLDALASQMDVTVDNIQACEAPAVSTEDVTA